MDDTYETLEFLNTATLRDWLSNNYSSIDGVWLKLHKKGSGLETITYAEALDVALCYGWIDGMRKSYDDKSYVQKFTPRRVRSLWSKRNIEHVARLTEEGLMTPAGVAEIERAKLDRRWAAAYDGPSTMTLPQSFLDELKQHPKAQAKFDAMTKSARYDIGWQLQTAKTQKTIDTRQQRIIEKLEDEA